VTDAALPLTTRLWFAWVCFFRVLFNGAFAARAKLVADGDAPPPTLPSATSSPPPKPPEPSVAASPSAGAGAPASDGALQLLALLQREGRLVDFVEQDIATFSDADVGAAARVVHEGCRKALRAHVKVAAVRTEEEGVKVTLAAGFAPSEVKLSGNVGGSAPYTGVLRHRGWRATEISLPTAMAGHDARVIAPAEVEL